MKQKKLPKMPYGQGSFKWGNKEQTTLRYYYSYKSPTDNKVYRLSVYGESAKECLKKMELKKAEKESSIQKAYSVSLENQEIHLGDAMTEWLRFKKIGQVKARTFDRDEVTINNQIKKYAISEMIVSSIDGDMISDHLRFLQYEAPREGKKSGYSYSTVKKTYEILNQFFQYYYSENINDNPMNKVKRPQQKKDIDEIGNDNAYTPISLVDAVLTDEEILRFKRQAYLPPRRGICGRTRYGVGLYFILMTFVRVGEAISLVWEDIDFEARTMRVYKTTSRVKDRLSVTCKTKVIMTAPKTERGKRIVMLNDEAIEALRYIQEHSSYTKPTDYVIATARGTRVSEDRLYLATKSILEASGLRNEVRDKCFGVHYLRHTGISFFLRHRVPVELVSKMAGHSNTSITMNTYYHILHEQNNELLELMNRVVNG